MQISIRRADITKIEADAIVNSANKTLMGGQGVDGCIHRGAGPGLLEECKKVRQDKYPKGLPTGRAVATRGYSLPCRIVIHTVGPKYKVEEISLLRDCYVNSLKIAEENNCKSIVFPSISTGVHGVPIQEAVKIVKEVILSFDSNIVEQVVFVLFNERDFGVYKEVLM